MAGTFKLRLLTPYCSCFEADAQGVMLPGEQGEFGILSNHTKFASTLKPGAVRIVTDDGKTTVFAITGGFAEVSDMGVMVLADSAERPEDIDIERAKKSKADAEAELASIDPSNELLKKRMEKRIERADNRIRLATHAGH